jgi:hypothetical protein
MGIVRNQVNDANIIIEGFERMTIVAINNILFFPSFAGLVLGI